MQKQDIAARHSPLQRPVNFYYDYVIQMELYYFSSKSVQQSRQPHFWDVFLYPSHRFI